MFSFNSHVGACPLVMVLGNMPIGSAIQPARNAMVKGLSPNTVQSPFRVGTSVSSCNLNIREAQKELESWVLTPNQLTVAEQALREIQTRLDFLVNVGLDYLNLDQKASTLSVEKLKGFALLLRSVPDWWG